MAHDWTRNVLSEERIVFDEDGKEHLIPEVLFFPKCARCGCLITLHKNEPLYRPTMVASWTTDEPECAA